MSRTIDIINEYKPYIDIMGGVLCTCVKNGDVSPNFQPLTEVEILIDLLENYEDQCLTQDMLNNFEDRLQDLTRDCDKLIPVPPPVDPTACPDNAIVTEDTADCLITEDTGDFIIVE